MLPVIRKNDFPYDVTIEQAQSALEELRQFANPDIDVEDYLVERPGIVIMAGRLVTSAVMPRLNVVVGSQLSYFEDGSTVPDSRMHRVINGEHVMVRPIPASGLTMIDVHRGITV